MASEVSVRDLAQEELPWMAEQERLTFGPSAWSEALIREDYYSGMKRYRAAVVADQRVGYAVYGFDGDAFHLMNVAVVEAARGKGVARALMADFLAEARNIGEREAWLEVAVTNDAALGLYRSLGFEEVRVRHRYYQPEDVDGVVMRVRLPPKPT